MRTYFAVLILSAVASFLATPLVRRLAFRIGAVDMPEARKIHREPMPRLGGLAVFLGFCAPWMGFYLLDNNISRTFQDFETLFLALVGGAGMMLVLGVYDDLKGANASQKLLVQVLTATALYWAGFRILRLSNPFGPSFELGWLSLPVSVLWIVAVTNAINLLDGIDGLVTGVTACIALALAVMNIAEGNILVALLALCLAGACLGFLPFNFSPARIFLGDTGSLFVGIVLACISMYSVFKGTTAALLFVPLILFGVPLFDTTSVVLDRLRRGVHLFQADKNHIHHRLLELGLNHKQVSVFLYSVTAFLGALAVLLSMREVPQSLLMACALLIGAVLIAWLALRSNYKKTNRTRSHVIRGASGGTAAREGKAAS